MSAFMTMITPSDWDDGFEETLSSFLYSRHALILEGLEGEIVELVTCSERFGICKAISKLTEKITEEGLSKETERRCFKRAAASIRSKTLTAGFTNDYLKRWKVIKRYLHREDVRYESRDSFTVSKDSKESPLDSFSRLLLFDLQPVPVSQQYVFFLAVCELCELLTDEAIVE